LRDPERPVNLVTADSVFAIADHPDCRHPLVKAHRGILKNGAHFDGELLLAAVAKPQLTGLYERVAFGLATGARNLAVRPAKKLGIVKGTLIVCEVSYCLGKSYRLFHVYDLSTKNRIAQIVLCVKYVIAQKSFARIADQFARPANLNLESPIASWVLHGNREREIK
jgi:hypothetical protein